MSDTPLPPAISCPTPETDDIRCSCCGVERREVGKMIAGPGFTLCRPCLELAVEIMFKDESNKGLITITQQEYADLQSASAQLNELREQARYLKLRPVKGFFDCLLKTLDIGQDQDTPKHPYRR